MSESWEYQCPACGNNIHPENINVSQNIALCRACGASLPFDELIDRKEEDQILSAPPKHLNVEKTPQGITITYKQRGFLTIFIPIFALIWTGVIWGIMIPRESGRDLFSALSCIPFIGLGIIFLAAALLFLFGKSIITVSPGKGTYFVGVFGIGLTRSFELLSETTFSEKTIDSDDDDPVRAMTINNRSQKSISIAHFMPQDAYPYLQVIFNQLKK